MAHVYGIGGGASGAASHHNRHHDGQQRGYDMPQLADASGERSHGLFSFHDMNLAVGDRLQIQCPDKVGGERSFVRIIGYLEHASLIVSSPCRNGLRVPLIERDPLVVRAFSRQSAFAFTTEVRHISHRPFEHLHLAFPTRIQGTMVRKSPRVRANIPCDVTVIGADAPLQVGHIDNLSASGALINALRPLGQVGSRVRLVFELDVHALQSAVELEAEIVCLHRNPGIDDPEGGGYQHGVDFQSPRPADLQLLKAFVYQRIIEVPQSVV